MSDQPGEATGHSVSQSSGGTAPVAVIPDPAEIDAYRVLLQASVAAEALQQRFAEFGQRRADLIADQKQLEADRSAFELRAGQFAAEVARVRSEHRELTAELELRAGRLSQQEELVQRQQGELRNAQRMLAEERVVLKQSVRAELDDERQKLGQDRAALDAERERLRQQNERDRGEHAECIAKVQSELRQEKNRLSELLRQSLAEETARLELRDAERQQQHDNLIGELQHQAEELQRQREQFGEQVEAEQQRLREEVEKKRQALLTEQSNLQRRFRFQFEHLARAKEDLEEELRAFRREQQLFRSERARFLEQHRLRFRQIERLRRLLQEREDSLEREARVLERSRNAVLSDLRLKQQRSDEEREAVVRDIENRQRRIRQQEASLAELTGRLEDRSQRLTRLRAELDQTQSEILEQRLVIEETRDALIRDAVAPELARARLEQARHDVAAYFERQRMQLFAERDKVEAAAGELADRQQQFRRDRGDLEQYFVSREEELAARSGATVVDQLQTQLELLRTKMERSQEAWQSERLEAERTIRSLIEQLTAREIPASSAGGTQQETVAPRDAA
ncbi:MAG: hypothetical protein ACKO2L_00935 [Planctomycetaceae bacterium]